MKINFRNFILSSILIIEIFVFSYTYLFGKNGVQALLNLKEENNKIQNQLMILKNENSKLKSQIQEFENDPFEKEKIARETLQMSKKNEQIYYI